MSGRSKIAAWLLVLLFAGEAVRARRERVAAVRRGREQEGLRRAEEERLRIARELHDVLAHNISLINVQSGVALHLLDERPEQARTALEEGPHHTATSGFLYFPYRGKTNAIKTLELVYGDVVLKLR